VLRTSLIRTARAIGVLLVSTFICFLLTFGNGPGIARAVVGIRANEEAAARKLAELGLDRPLLDQYWSWLFGVLHGDLGRSYFSGQTVIDALSVRAPVTLGITTVVIVLTAIVAMFLGVGAATRGGWIDRLVQFLSVLGTALPSFIVAIGLTFAFAVALRWLPATGYVSPEQGALAWLASITLPSLSLLVGSIAGAAQQFRAATLETLSCDWVRTLRARGVPERLVIFQHVLRNSAGPGLTVLSLSVFSVLGGAVFIEQVFALPGLGKLGVQSALKGDVPMVMGTVLVTILVVLVVNFLGDTANTALNPKARAK
jgi:peptide/nickel transport system permease protein